MHRSENGDENVALSRFESMLKTNNIVFFDAEEFEDIIHYYLENGKMALAKKATKLGLEQHPASTPLKLFQVETYIFESKFDIADEILDQLYTLERSNEEIFIQKASILSRKNNHKQAIKLLEKALKITNDERDVLSLIGMEYLFLDDFENAKYYFMKCIEIDMQDYASLYNLVYCFEYLEERQQVIEYLNMYLDKSPYSEVAWHQLGKQYFNTNQFEKALMAFDFAIISDDTFVGAYLEKGKVLEKLKKYTEAIENYTISLELDDPTAFALLRIGKCYKKLDNDELALHYYNKCVEEDALLDKGWISITDHYIKQGNYQKAQYYIDKALSIDSENVLYWKRYAKINKYLGYYEEAEEGYRKALEHGSYEIDTWIARADILIKLGEYNAAIKNLNQASKYYSESSEIEYRNAGLHFITNNLNKGHYHLKNALKINWGLHSIIQELFPSVFNLKKVRKIIEQSESASQ